MDWRRKLTSRKFWMAVALFVSGILTAVGSDQGEEVAGLIMQGAAVVAYIIGEGLADAANPSIFVEADDEEDSID